MQLEGGEQRLIQHLERHLGKMAGGWMRGPSGEQMPFQVARFDSPPIRACTAFATVGLSSFPLRSNPPGRDIYLELFMIMRRADAVIGIPDLLQTAGTGMLASGVAILRGDVLGPRGPIWPQSRLEAFYVASPAYLPDEFAGCDLENGVRCAIAWLVPITRGEADYVKARGWRAFEEVLATEDPDLLQFDRAEMKLAPPRPRPS